MTPHLYNWWNAPQVTALNSLFCATLSNYTLTHLRLLVVKIPHQLIRKTFPGEW